uniref:Uncharacterized protein n=1 Tax=Myoviridae sp. ct9Ns12 TaxID=2826626 RepID=A0A8S5MIE3_9CAUD|nr:MAG TPA: hypothetical protein [Myoviridae sp. ct9Ns12]
MQAKELIDAQSVDRLFFFITQLNKTRWRKNKSYPN